MADTDRCLSVRQTAAYLGVAPAKVRRFVKQRLLRAIQVGERRHELRITPDALAEFCQRQAAFKPRAPRRRRGEAIDPEVLAMLGG